jgi:DNA-binding transcriptional regulator LsrR (DeoR family)
MSDKPYTDDQLLMAARLYYDDGMPQARVAKLVNVSQAKVSRMLAMARKRGIVTITVQPYDPRHRELEKALQKALGLKDVIVIKSATGVPAEELRKTVGHFSASDVAKMIQPGAIIAVAGGRAVRELARSLVPSSREMRLTVLQSMGNVDANVAPYDALELARTIAGRWGGSLLSLNTPALLPDRKTTDAFLELEQIQTVKKRLAKSTIALVGVGTPENSVFIDRGLLKPEDRARLSKAGAVGEICGRYFDARGRECDTPLRRCVVSIELDELKKVPQVVGVVAASDRSAAIAAAVKGGILKSLVIDQAGAAALLSWCETQED